ncbi:substrate-binding domain-containing protein [Methylibium sp.]|uniref:substrate-binding domain-containing protein n=1 Tax=Methylibium sp. TaxID=2067992 RepID=UPI0025F458AF|nr:substrate-binding domain-containing protein [Methylibium sp.]
MAHSKSCAVGAGQRATAFTFVNDHYACGAMIAAQAAGLAVPEDVALLGARASTGDGQADRPDRLPRA